MSKRETILTSINIADAGTDISSSPVSYVIQTDGVEALTLLVSVTGASSDVISIDVETSNDGVNYYPMTTLSDASGTTDVYNRGFEFTMTGSSDKFQIPLNVQNKFTKITVGGGGTNTAQIIAELLS